MQLDFLTSGTTMGYNNGMIIIAFLLVIHLCLARLTKKRVLPKFCAKCIHVGHMLLSRATTCKLRCKYNPPYAILSAKSFYKK